MNTNLVLSKIEELLLYAQNNLFLDQYNLVYARNNLLEMFDLEEQTPNIKTFSNDIDIIVGPLIKTAIETNIIKDTSKEINYFKCKLLGIVTPAPSCIIQQFDVIAGTESTEAAMKWLYKLQEKNDYIKTKALAQNIQWKTTTQKGDIVVTINLAKPEKDPKLVDEELKASKQKNKYPKCDICLENLGFRGSAKQTSKYTLRPIPIPLNNREWFIQYSNYQYLDQHIIVISKEHQEMAITADTFKDLLDFVEIFPTMFLGSNAALPIVGGSILAHNHYQGGNKVLPLFTTAVRNEFSSEKYKDVKFFIADWYNSVIRIESDNKKQLSDAAAFILNKWEKYENKKINIVNKTGKTPHNAITPLARNENGTYILDLVLRNNRCDKEHPFGIFHPDENLHNIKKESIGIIEVAGIFILPGRLKNELSLVADLLTGKTKLDFEEIVQENHALSKHFGLVAQLTNDHGVKNNDKDAQEHIRNYVSKLCVDILDTTAVFKNDKEGQKEFINFMKKSLDLQKIC